MPITLHCPGIPWGWANTLHHPWKKPTGGATLWAANVQAEKEGLDKQLHVPGSFPEEVRFGLESLSENGEGTRTPAWSSPGPWPRIMSPCGLTLFIPVALGFLGGISQPRNGPAPEVQNCDSTKFQEFQVDMEKG